MIMVDSDAKRLRICNETFWTWSLQWNSYCIGPCFRGFLHHTLAKETPVTCIIKCYPSVLSNLSHILIDWIHVFTRKLCHLLNTRESTRELYLLSLVGKLGILVDSLEHCIFLMDLLILPRLVFLLSSMNTCIPFVFLITCIVFYIIYND